MRRVIAALFVILLVGATVAAAATTASNATAGNATCLRGTPAPQQKAEMGWQAIVTVVTVAVLLIALGLELLPCSAAMFVTSLFLLLCGIISTPEFLAGLSNAGVVTIGLLYVVIDPITGLPVIRWLIGKCMSGERMWLATLRVCLLCLSTSWFINNTPLVAMLTPLIKQACRDKGWSPSQVLMPMNAATLVGGTFAIIGTSTNLIYDGLYRSYGFGRIPFFEVAKVSIVPGFILLWYFVFAPRCLLPSAAGGLFRLMRERGSTFLAQLVVAPDSPLVGVPVSEWQHHLAPSLREQAELVEVVRPSGAPVGHETIQAYDILVFNANIASFQSAAAILRLNWLPLGTNPTEIAFPNRSFHELTPHMGLLPPENEPQPLTETPLVGAGPQQSGVLRGSFDEMPRSVEARGVVLTGVAGRGSFAGLSATASVHHQFDTLGEGQQPSVPDPQPAGADVVVSTESVGLGAVAAAGGGGSPTVAAGAVDGALQPPEFVEVVLSDKSKVVGHSSNSGYLQRLYGVALIAIRAAGQDDADLVNPSQRATHIFAVGDTLLVLGSPLFLEQFADHFFVASRCETNTSKVVAKYYIAVPHWCCIGIPVGEETAVHREEDVTNASPRNRPHAANEPFTDEEVKDLEAEAAEAEKRRKAPKIVRLPDWYPYVAVVIFIAMMSCAIAGFDIVICAACAAVAMIFCKMMSVREAMQAVEIDVIVMVAFSFGIGSAMKNSGLAGVIGELIVGANIVGAKLLFLLTFTAAVITNTVTNKVCAQVMFPIAAAIYTQQGISPLGPIVLLACVTSIAMVTPYGFATNIIIMGPGGYRPIDFVKFGFPATLLMDTLMTLAALIVYDLW